MKLISFILIILVFINPSFAQDSTQSDVLFKIENIKAYIPISIVDMGGEASYFVGSEEADVYHISDALIKQAKSQPKTLEYLRKNKSAEISVIVNIEREAITYLDILKLSWMLGNQPVDSIIFVTESKNNSIYGLVRHNSKYFFESGDYLYNKFDVLSYSAVPETLRGHILREEFKPKTIPPPPTPEFPIEFLPKVYAGLAPVIIELDSNYQIRIDDTVIGEKVLKAKLKNIIQEMKDGNRTKTDYVYDTHSMDIFIYLSIAENITAEKYLSLKEEILRICYDEGYKVYLEESFPYEAELIRKVYHKK